jgi:SAM-dependent methyltransferase
MTRDLRKYLSEKLRSIAGSFLSFLEKGSPDRSGFDAIEYWKDRAKEGAHTVMHRSHGPEEMEAVTNRQLDILLPHLREHLSGQETCVLDLGCGPGRFTQALAATIGGDAIGVDPIPALLREAPVAENVEYRLMETGSIPLPKASIDVVWICLVLGGIVDDAVLHETAREIERVLRSDGLLFLVENTSDKPDATHWAFRSVSAYDRLFDAIEISECGSYMDAGETITIMAGRKHKPTETEMPNA